MICITITLLTIYLLLVSQLIWKNTKHTKAPKIVPHKTQKNHHYLSIIVPVRNEEKTIGILLHSIVQQQGHYEIIVVNDHSDDLTVSEVEKFIKNHQKDSIKILHLQEETSSPKKTALTLAIQEAKGNIIVTTDGDCVVPNNWIEVINKSFEEDNIKMVLGGVHYSPTKNLFETIQAYELAALLTLSMVMAKNKKPFTCNGANLAYKKNIFHDVNGFDGVDQIASGDDELLMKKIYAKYPNGISIQEEAFVDTLPNKNITQLFNQRVRWASKWKYGTWKEKIPGAFLMLMYLSFLIVPFTAHYRVEKGNLFYLFFLLLGTKFILDSIVIIRTYNRKDDNKEFNYFIALILFIIYPFYVVFFGLTATFLKFSWKGRKLN
jgi:biofilm PGA synthesis N-glycosyltransferase PgaC